MAPTTLDERVETASVRARALAYVADAVAHHRRGLVALIDGVRLLLNGRLQSSSRRAAATLSLVGVLAFPYHVVL